MVNLCSNNCHTHVATALNPLLYRGRDDWNTPNLMRLLVTHGQYPTRQRMIALYLPFFLVLFIAILFFFLF